MCKKLKVVTKLSLYFFLILPNLNIEWYYFFFTDFYFQFSWTNKNVPAWFAMKIIRFFFFHIFSDEIMKKGWRKIDEPRGVATISYCQSRQNPKVCRSNAVNHVAIETFQCFHPRLSGTFESIQWWHHRYTILLLPWWKGKRFET